MNAAEELETRRIVSRIAPDGELRVWLEEARLPPPAAGEVTVAIEAAPIHPSNIGLMFDPMEIGAARQAGTATHPAIVAQLTPAQAQSQAQRLGQEIAAGTEGAGTVVRAGSGAEHLMGRRVAVWGAATYCDRQNFPAKSCIVLPDDVSTEQGAAAFINPLTVLGMVATMRRDGHRAIVHTAAASSVGRMLQRVCREEGIPLVNVVRRPELARELEAEGATHVVDSSAADFEDRLIAAIDETEARMAFDPIGGKMPGRLLRAMELSARKRMSSYSRYGSPEPKQCYVYGALDTAPVEIPRTIGLAWSCSGWLLHHFLARVDEEELQGLYARIRDGLPTIFASSYGRKVSLPQALELDVVRDYFARGTGAKVLITP